jgi:hypothetical protein
MSSLLRPIKNLGLTYTYPKGLYDYNIGEAMQIVEEREVLLKNLDSVLLSNPQLPIPRFLSIDTQGTELNILQGAKRILPEVNGVLTEVAFTQFYEDQPLFCSIDSFLRDEGFVLMHIYPGVGVTNNRSHISFRAKGQIAWGDALYFRKPESSSDLVSLAFIALCFGFSDYARNCLPLNIDRSNNLGKLLSEFQLILTNKNNSLPIQFHEFYDKKTSKERYLLTSKQESFQNIMKGGPKIKLVIIKILRAFYLYRIGRNVYRFIRYLKHLILLPIQKWFRGYRSSPLLRFAKKYGLIQLEKELIKFLRKNY